MRRLAPALVALLAFGAAAQTTGVLPFSAVEVARIVAHGPWPPPPRKDPSNRVSGNAAAIAFGATLFGDPRLSVDRTIACATCHRADRALADGLPRAQGLAGVDRNTPTVADAHLQRWFGWDGAGDSLWAQSLRPIVDPREMGSYLAHIAAMVRGNDDLLRSYRDAFGAAPAADDEAIAVDVAKALAAFQETLSTGHYSEIDEDRLHADGERILKPLRLSAAEIDDLVAFLESLAAGGP